MRRTALLAAAVGGLVASSSFAAFVVTSSAPTPVGATGLFQIDIFARNNGIGGTGSGLLALDVAMNAKPTDRAFFRSTAAGSPNLTNATETANRSFFRIDAADPSTSSLVSRSPAGNFPLAPDQGANTVGIDDFGVVLASLTGAVPAGTGAGALFGTLFVTAGYSGTLSGQLGGETGTAQSFSVNIGAAGTVNTAPVVLPTAPTPVVFGAIVSNGAPFSVTVNTTDANAADVLSLALGALPAGITGTAVAGGGTSPESFTITGTVAYSLNKTTVTIPFTVSDGAGGSTQGSFNLVVTPEPASLAALAGAAGLGLIRRRK